jgi:rhamnosyltransferase
VHALGTPVVRQLPWRTIGSSNHSAARRYYMTRNHVILARQYLFKEPAWVLRTVYTRLKSLLMLLVFDDDRMLKIRLMGRGLAHGLANRTGVLPPLDTGKR